MGVYGSDIPHGDRLYGAVEASAEVVPLLATIRHQEYASGERGDLRNYFAKSFWKRPISVLLR